MKCQKTILLVVVVAIVGASAYFMYKRKEAVRLENALKFEESVHHAKYLALNTLKHLVGLGFFDYKMKDMFDTELLNKISQEECHTNPKNLQEAEHAHFQTKCEESVNTMLEYLKEHPEVLDHYKNNPELLQL